MAKTIAIDFDGTLVKPEINGDLLPVPGAVDAVKRLIARGHTLVISSARANSQDGVCVIRAWLSSQGLPELPIYPKVGADCYVDDKALGFIGDWGSVTTKIDGIPSQAIASFGSRVYEGQHSLKEIGEYLKFSSKDFNSDLESLYAAKDDAESLSTVAHRIKRRYGIDVEPRRLFASREPEQYIRECLATAISKYEDQVPSVNDTVCFKRTRRYGTLGTITALSDIGVDLYTEDGPVQTDIKDVVIAPHEMSAPEKPIYHVEPSLATPEGLTQEDCNKWYEMAQAHILHGLGDKPFCRTHKLPHTLVPAQEKEMYCGDAPALLSPSVVGISGYNLPGTTAIILQVEDPYKLPVAELYDSADQFLTAAGIRDAHMVYDGERQFILTLTHDASFNPELNKLEDSILRNAGLTLRIQCSGLTPAAYSINPKTGRICFPVDIMGLSAFNPDKVRVKDA